MNQTNAEAITESSTSSKKRGTRKPSARKSPGSSRDELVRAALRLFADSGFERVTIKDIAQARGFDSALIYFYFRDKNDLFEHAVQLSIQEALAEPQRLSDDTGNPADAISNWFARCIVIAEKIQFSSASCSITPIRRTRIASCLSKYLRSTHGKRRKFFVPTLNGGKAKVLQTSGS